MVSRWLPLCLSVCHIVISGWLPLCPSVCHIVISGWLPLCLSVCQCVRLSYICPSVFLFLDDNLSKYQWNFTKLGLCIDILDFWLLMGKFRQFLSVICLPHIRIFISTWLLYKVKINGFSLNLVCALRLCRSGLGLLMRKFYQFLTVVCPQYICYLVSGQ